MLRDGIDAVGFDAAMRQKLLTQVLGLPYDVRVFDSYEEVFLRTRNGECDIGWAPFFARSSRD